jgi:hypothetical protein
MQAMQNGMSPTEIRARLHGLARERLEAERWGLNENETYMADLDEEIVAHRLAYVGTAVTEIALLRADLSGPNFG